MKKILFLAIMMITISANVQSQKFKNAPRTTSYLPETLPAFPGGAKKFEAFIDKNLGWPKDDGMPVEGRVLVSFFVEKDGSLTEMRIAKSLSPAFDREALTLLAKSPKWIPGKKMGKPMRRGYIVSIPFHVSEN
jgi:protein TonB